VPALETVFTCDFLGAHYACSLGRVMESSLTDDEREHAIGDAFKYYYDCIMSPFPTFVKKGLEIIRGLYPPPK
ncbi:hypothetical protein KIPB_017025, partial [Kipferlia bialata]